VKLFESIEDEKGLSKGYDKLILSGASKIPMTTETMHMLILLISLYGEISQMIRTKNI